jgi:hypothetical protein
MKSVARNAALFIALACAVWVAVLWHWRSTPQDLDGAQIVLYLGVLPLVVFALVLALRWAVRAAQAQQLATRDPDPPAAGSAGKPLEARVPPALPWHLQGAWVNTAAGSSVQAVLAAIEAGAPRPQPDGRLVDDQGLPTLTARIANLDLQQVQRGMTPPAPPERALRALASLSPLIDDLAGALQHWAAPGQATHSDLPMAADLRRVRVLAAWPLDWDDATCASAQTWLKARLCEALDGLLPAASWSVSGQRLSGHALLATAQQTLDALADQGRDDPVVLMACHSDLDASAIDALARDQQLFHASDRPKVSMAGEGAAVLLLSALAWHAASPPAPDSGPVQLSSPTLVRRTASIEAAGRVSSDDLVQVIDLSLAAAGLDSQAVANLSCDADQHTGRATELFAMTLARLPELDANEDLRLAGTLTGRLGAAAPLLTMALAADQVRNSGRPAVAVSLADTHWRMATVVGPSTTLSKPPVA